MTPEIRHKELFKRIFIDADGNPTKAWRKLMLGSKRENQHLALKEYILSVCPSKIYGEFLYLLTHDEYPKCPVCGEAIKYKHKFTTYCSKRCAAIAQDMTKNRESRKQSRAEFIESISDGSQISDEEALSKLLVQNGGQVFFSKFYTQLKSSIQPEHAAWVHYLSTRIPWARSWSETIYCLHHKISEQPKCTICGKLPSYRNFSFGYNKYCSVACVNKDEEVLQHRQDAMQDNFEQRMAHYRETISKRPKKETLPKRSKEELRQITSESQKKLWSDPAYKEKMRIALSKGHANSSPEMKQQKIDKYKSWWNGLSDEGREDFLRKQYNAKKEHHSFNVSAHETELYEYVKQRFPDALTQYRSPRYCFCCDFYIPSLDVFIEYQGTWTHGGHPYDPDSQADIDLVGLWRSKNTAYYDAAIKTWTIRDPKKRQTAIDNNLKWHEAWTVAECKELIDRLYEEQHNSPRQQID